MSGIYGELLSFPQENGSDVRLRVFGSHHYSRYENVDGFTVVYDKDLGLFCFAELLRNRLISTGIKLDQPPLGLVRHLQDTNPVIISAIESSKSRMSAESLALEQVNRTFGPNRGLLHGRVLSIGTIRGLTILVNFADVTSTTTAADVDRMVNEPGYNENGNISSVRDYFLRVSNGKLDYSNTVVGPFTLQHNRAHYIENLLVEEALELAVASGVDLNEFDSRGEGIVDALNILYAGQSVYQDNLWPHNSSIALQHGSVRTNLYLLTGLGRNASELSIGTFCHENGHLLCRFPDMYDYGKRDNDGQDSAGIGRFCLMGSGNHLDFGRSPAPVCAYLRDLAGWCDNVIDLNVSGGYTAVHGDYGTVMKYRTDKPNEYFIVENRTRMGLDRALPASGLAIYHCDIFGSNEWQQGAPDRHYQCALLQADGRRDLENNPANQGDSEDLFGPVDGLAIASTTNPHTREWDNRDSGLHVSDITVSNSDIGFWIGAQVNSLTVESVSIPDLPIPDNDPQGVSDSIVIAASGVVRRVEVALSIAHTYVGDLLVHLVSPTGVSEALFVREGGSTDDLHASFDSDRPGELTNLVGQPMQGSWILKVTDRANVDTGRLVQWSIKLESDDFSN